MLGLVEFTSWIQDDPSGYSDNPEFEKDLWPLIATSRDISDVCLLRSRFSAKKSLDRLSMKVVDSAWREFPLRLGQISKLSEQDRGALSHLTTFGGHLSVLYQFAGTGTLQTLLRLWPRHSALSTDFSLLGLNSAELTGILHALNAFCTDGHVVVAFAHDGDPMYLFGEDTAVADILIRLA